MIFNRRPDTRAVNPPSRLLLALLPLILLSCGPDSLEGRVVLSGSSTLAPLVAKSVEKWKAVHPRVEVRVEAIGSDAGFEKLILYRDADLALMSRPVGEADRAAAAASGKTLVVFPVAWDAVTLVVPASNTWADTLTTEQTVQAFTTAGLWSDLDPAWPNIPLNRFVPGPRSGTTDVFAAALLAGNKAKLFGIPAAQASEDDEILARGLARVEGSIGFLGWTTVGEVSSSLRIVGLDGVKPSPSTVRDKTYGLPRQLWMVASTPSEEDQTATASLLRFFYEHYDELLSDSLLIPLSEEERKDAEALVQTIW